MRTVKFALSLLSLVLVTGAFFGLPFAYLATWYQAGPAAFALFSSEPLAWLPFVVLLALTLLFGRFFCEAMCPLGAVQTIVNFVFHPRMHVRRVCTRLPQTPVQMAVRWGVAAAFAALAGFGFAGVAALVEPYGLWGRALSLSAPALAVVGIVIVLAAIGRGRIWCNWICPVGTLVAAVAKVAPCGNRVGGGCANCRACFAAKQNKVKDMEVDTHKAEGVERREVLKGVAVLAASEKLTDGGLAAVSMPNEPDRGVSVLPPGARSHADLARRCIACGLCMKVCPEKIIRQSTHLATLGQPELDFRNGHCLPGCMKCGTVCPTDALVQLQRETKSRLHIGTAVWTKERCIRTASGVECTACVRKCPVRAIHLVGNVPVVDADACVGCGACEHVCPARPEPAIHVKGLDVQRTVRPISESDLLDEMKALVAGGTSVVAARDGVIVAQETGRGVAPLLKLADAGLLKDAVVVDKVIGRAAAAICVQGGATHVYARLMSNDAAADLRARGIACAAETMVEKILNRDKTDVCPMEKAVAGMADPAKMVAAIRKTAEELRKANKK